ncbi:gamma-mobile-trio protein GmtX [Neorhizobium galegae]|uniref:gamma-mobile-trio protein GmtX n=1 Tax=Neorhizobium galegae TaxID=399 RepID=UPI00349E5FB8
MKALSGRRCQSGGYSYSERLGGPKTQSIRNKQGEVFRSLIEAFAEDEGRRIKRPQKALPPIEEAIAKISDRGTQLALRLEIKANARLKAENDRLKAAFKVLSVVPTVNRSLDQSGNDPPKLSEIEFDSIARFLGSAWREERLWSLEEDGSIVEQPSGTLIAPPGFVTALQEILASGLIETKESGLGFLFGMRCATIPHAYRDHI